jgi:Flp pilus assembly CpaE family ATPase
MAFDIDHPDLIDVGRRLQRRLDMVLEAEQQAAAVLARRMSTIRDRLLDAEDAGSHVTIVGATGGRYSGTLAAVGADHVELRSGLDVMLVMLDAIVAVSIA